MTPYQFGSAALKLAEYTESASNVINFSDAVTKLGLTEVTSDAGNIISISKYITSTAEATTAATTGETVAISGAVDVATSGTTATATGAVIGNSGATLISVPKAVAACALAGAFGLEVGLVGGQIGYNLLTGNDPLDDIVWNPFTVGGELIGWMTDDGTTYFPREWMEGVKNRWLEQGVFDEALSDHTGNWTNETVPTMGVESSAYFAYNLLEEYIQTNAPSTTWASGMRNQIKNQLDNINWGVLGSGIAIINLYLYWGSVSGYGHTDIKVYHTNEVESGHLDSNSIAYNVNNGSIQIGENVAWDRVFCEYGTQGTYTSGTTSSPLNLGDEQITLPRNGWSLPYASYSSLGGIMLYNIGELNTVIVPKQPGITTFPDERPLPQTYPQWMPEPAPHTIPVSPEVPDTELAPLGLPNDNTALNPQNENEPQNRPQPEAQEGLNDLNLLDGVLDLIPEIPFNELPPTDDIGDTPAIIPPTSGSDTGLVHIYNPTLTELAKFSQWLWSANVFDNFSKLFQDPMQAILGLNLLYATPTVATTKANIVVGNLTANEQGTSSMPITSYYVTNQYIDIDCGSVTISRYFNNVLDYIDTKIELYLPFVGIVELSAPEMVGKTVNIKCTVDVLTGTCLYQIYVGSQLLYTFTGNCAVQLPLTGANYTAMYSTLFSIAGNAIGGAIRGGPVGGVIGGAVGAGIGAVGGGLQHNVERSSNIGSNAGAMGVKVPYLIITRHKPYNPTAYNKYYGYPSNTTVKLNRCSGFTRVKDIRLHDIYTYDEDAKVVATDDEMSMIETQLKEGVII